MKQIAWFSVISALILSSCATTPQPPFDYSKVDDECAQKCQKDQAECVSRYAELPTLKYTHCSPEEKACAKACPPPGTSTAARLAKSKSVANPENTVAQPSIADRLKQLGELHKSGLITDKEYSDKRQEILKSL